MNRLTMKFDNDEMHYDMGDQYETTLDDGIQYVIDVNNKLGALEDIEDELGCPLETVFKALKNGFYDGCGKFIECPELSGTSKEGWIIGNALSDYQFFRLRDYGKKGPDGWVLTKEELE